MHTPLLAGQLQLQVFLAQPGVVVHTYNSSTQEAKVKG
jgi:hypothetical protein